MSPTNKLRAVLGLLTSRVGLERRQKRVYSAIEIQNDKQVCGSVIKHCE